MTIAYNTWFTSPIDLLTQESFETEKFFTRVLIEHSASLLLQRWRDQRQTQKLGNKTLSSCNDDFPQFLLTSTWDMIKRELKPRSHRDSLSELFAKLTPESTQVLSDYLDEDENYSLFDSQEPLGRDKLVSILLLKKEDFLRELWVSEFLPLSNLNKNG